MRKYNRGAHTVWNNTYHIVWITKYRYRILSGDFQRYVRSTIIETSESLRCEILSGALSADHVHIHVKVPPSVAISDYVQRIKGKSSFKAFQIFPNLKKKYWGGHLWGRGYWCTTTGNVSQELVDEYINNHIDGHKKNFEDNILLT